MWAALGIGALVLGSLLLAALLYFRPERPKTIDSVAVLPFANASADPNTEYLSDGITESLIDTLSQLPNLRVVARSTVFRFKGKPKAGRREGHKGPPLQPLPYLKGMYHNVKAATAVPARALP